jgi:hypothetical protein
MILETVVILKICEQHRKWDLSREFSIYERAVHCITGCPTCTSASQYSRRLVSATTGHIKRSILKEKPLKTKSDTLTSPWSICFFRKERLIVD